MKKSKKFLMALAICSLSVVVIGCSSNEKKNTSNGTTETTEKKENKETKEDKTEKLSNEEIVKKLTEAFSSINSSKQKTEFKNTFNSFGRKAETTLIMDVITSSNPTISKVSSTMIVQLCIIQKINFMLMNLEQKIGIILKMKKVKNECYYIKKLQILKEL